MLWLLGLMHLVLSLGDVNALIPLIIILILIVAAGGLTRGFSIFSLFGLGTLTGIGLGGRGSMAKRTGYDKSAIPYPGGFASDTNNKKIQQIRKDSSLSRSEKFKAMGSIRGAKQGNAPASPSLISGAYHSYRNITGKNTAKFSASNLKGPLILSKDPNGSVSKSGPLIISGAAGSAAAAGSMTVKQVNDAVFNRVRMAVMDPRTVRPRVAPENPTPLISPKDKNTLPFSSIGNAVAWTMAGRTGAQLTTSKMRKLAASNPKAFRREYSKIVRNELHRDMFNQHMSNVRSSFRMPADNSERTKFKYTGTIYKEWQKEIQRRQEEARNSPAGFNLKIKSRNPDYVTHTWVYNRAKKRWEHTKSRLSEED